MDLRSTYNRIAEDWYKDHSDDHWWVAATNHFCSFLKTGDLVLDVGCGAGVKSKFLIEKGLGVVGVDFSDKMIELAKRNVPEGTFHVMDMHDLTSLKQTFEGIFVQAALLHIPKSEVSKVFTEFVDRLKPGGYLYVAVKQTREGQKDEETVKENDYGYEYERFFSYFTVNEMKNYFAQFHVRVISEDVMVAGKTRWVQVIGRRV